MNDKDNMEVEKAVDVGLSPTEDKYSTRSIHEEPDMFHITKFIKLLNYETTTSSSKIMESLLDNLHHYVSCRLFFTDTMSSTPSVSEKEFEEWLLYLTYMLVNTNYSALKSLISHQSKPLSIITRYVKKNIFVDHVGYLASNKTIQKPPQPANITQEQTSILYAFDDAWTETDFVRMFSKLNTNTTVSGTIGFENVKKYMEAYKVLLKQFASYDEDTTMKSSMKGLYSIYKKFYEVRRFHIGTSDAKGSFAKENVYLGNLGKIYHAIKRKDKTTSIFERIPDKNSFISFSKTIDELWNEIKNPKVAPQLALDIYDYLNLVQLTERVDIMYDAKVQLPDKALMKKYYNWMVNRDEIQFLRCSILLADAQDLIQLHNLLNNTSINNPSDLAKRLLVLCVAQRAYRTIDTRSVLDHDTFLKLELLLIIVEIISLESVTDQNRGMDTSEYAGLNTMYQALIEYATKRLTKERTALFYYTDYPYLKDFFYSNRDFRAKDVVPELDLKDPIAKHTQAEDKLEKIEPFVPYFFSSISDFRDTVGKRYRVVVRDMIGIADTIRFLSREQRSVELNFFKYLIPKQIETLHEALMSIYAKPESKLKAPLIWRIMASKITLAPRTTIDDSAKLSETSTYNTNDPSYEIVKLDDVAQQAKTIASKIKGIAKKMSVHIGSDLPYDFASIKYAIHDIYLHVISGETLVQSQFFVNARNNQLVLDDIQSYLDHRTEYPDLMGYEKHGLLFSTMIGCVQRLKDLLRNAREQFMATIKIVNVTAAGNLIVVKNEEMILFYMIDELFRWVDKIRVDTDPKPGVDVPTDKSAFKVDGFNQNQMRGYALPQLVVEERSDTDAQGYNAAPPDDSDDSFAPLFNGGDNFGVLATKTLKRVHAQHVPPRKYVIFNKTHIPTLFDEKNTEKVLKNSLSDKYTLVVLPPNFWDLITVKPIGTKQPDLFLYSKDFVYGIEVKYFANDTDFEVEFNTKIGINYNIKYTYGFEGQKKTGDTDKLVLINKSNDTEHYQIALLVQVTIDTGSTEYYIARNIQSELDALQDARQHGAGIGMNEVSADDVYTTKFVKTDTLGKNFIEGLKKLDTASVQPFQWMGNKGTGDGKTLFSEKYGTLAYVPWTRTLTHTMGIGTNIRRYTWSGQMEAITPYSVKLFDFTSKTEEKVNQHPILTAEWIANLPYDFDPRLTYTKLYDAAPLFNWKQVKLWQEITSVPLTFKHVYLINYNILNVYNVYPTSITDVTTNPTIIQIKEKVDANAMVMTYKTLDQEVGLIARIIDSSISSKLFPDETKDGKTVVYVGRASENQLLVFFTSMTDDLYNASSQNMIAMYKSTYSDTVAPSESLWATVTAEDFNIVIDKTGLAFIKINSTWVQSTFDRMFKNISFVSPTQHSIYLPADGKHTLYGLDESHYCIYFRWRDNVKIGKVNNTKTGFVEGGKPIDVPVTVQKIQYLMCIPKTSELWKKILLTYKTLILDNALYTPFKTGIVKTEQYVTIRSYVGNVQTDAILYFSVNANTYQFVVRVDNVSTDYPLLTNQLSVEKTIEGNTYWFIEKPDTTGESKFTKFIPTDDSKYTLDNMIAYSEMISFLKYLEEI